ncbi:MAG: Asp-tRNA(Asn)/Glu-tRNA(Gln) amidotransferase subunit GatC [Candidatus Staskawiczbacteria bacterium]|nr:Asp-tRNA(Asn)/Glu-tRNA(Gln) amidotransferase subunit GatC [Candidatus Staskawiczbacteria bacterium]
MISKEEVLRIAKLARLELSDKEVEKMQKDLSAILDYFALLKKAPKLSKAQIASAKVLSLRRDEIISQNREVVEKLIDAAPDKKDDYIKVKTIL